MTKPSISPDHTERKAQSERSDSAHSNPAEPHSERRRKVPTAEPTDGTNPPQAGTTTGKPPSIKELQRKRRLAREAAAKAESALREESQEPVNEAGSTSTIRQPYAELLDESQLNDAYVAPPPAPMADNEWYDPDAEDCSDGASLCSPSGDCEEASQEKPRRVTVPKLMEELKKEGHGGVWVPPLARRITGNGDQALCLSQLLYWFDKDNSGRVRARCFKNGRYWVYKTHEQLGEETGLSAPRVKVCLKALEDRGFIIRGYFLANGLRTTHISVESQNVFQAMADAFLTRQNTGQHDSCSRSA